MDLQQLLILKFYFMELALFMARFELFRCGYERDFVVMNDDPCVTSSWKIKILG